MAPALDRWTSAPGAGERSDLAVAVLRVVRRCRRRRPRRAGGTLRRWPAPAARPGRARRRGRAPRRAAARRCRGRPRRGRGARAGGSGRSSGAPGRRCRRRRRSRRRCARRPVAQQRPSATIRASWHSWCRRRRGRAAALPGPPTVGRRPARDRPGRHVAAEAPQHRLGRGGEVGAPGPEQRELDRGAERGGVRLDLARPPRVPAAWRPARSARRTRRRRAGAAPRGWRARRPRRRGRGRRRPRAEVTPTPAWSRSASSCWQPVPDAATMPTGPGCTTLAKPSPSPPTTAVPQSGPITSSPRSAATRLRATSCSTGTLSLKTITSAPASRASIASTVALAPGTETRTSAAGRPSAARSPWCGAGRARRRRWRRTGGVRRPPARASTAASAAVERVVVVHPQRDDHVVGAARRGRRSPSREHLDVERGGHRDLGGEHAVDGRPRRGSPGGASTESAYAPERSSTCDFVGGSCRILQSRGSRARAGRPTTARRRTCARSPCRAAAAASSAGVPRAARYAANSGSTSPCRAQSSRVADSRVVRSRVPRTAAATSSVRRSVATSTASQPHSTSSPSGVRPPPLPTRPCSTSASIAKDRSRGREMPRWRRAASPRCGRSGGPRLRIPRARRPKDSAEIDPGNANIHESSDAEGVAGQIQGPALNIGAGGAGGENYLGRHARDLRRQAQRAGHLGGPRERRRRRSGRPPRRTARRATGAAPATGPSGAERRCATTRGGAPADHAWQGPRFPTLSAAVTFDRCEVVPTIPEDGASSVDSQERRVTIRDDAPLRSPGWTRCTRR